MRRVCVITGTRAEYGLLYWLMREIQKTDGLQLQVLVTGMHLSPEFGLTYQQVENDGFTIDRKVEMLLSSDSEVGIGKSMGVAMIGFSDAFSELKPDILVLLGDRFETFAAASTAAVMRIPVAHIHGGELTEGAFDEMLRHSITKMSHLHFTSTEVYRTRVIQLGEQPDRVFCVGALGIDNIKKLELLSRERFEEAVGLQLRKKNLLITYHPVTMEAPTAAADFNELLSALDELEDTALIFTKANADTGGRAINRAIDRYVADNNDKAVAHTSLGQLRYLSALQFVDGVVGNSSSGLLEAPSFCIGTVNIGERQRGRMRGESVIDCGTSRTSIANALNQLYTLKFRQRLLTVINPYGEGGAAERIARRFVTSLGKDCIKKLFMIWREGNECFCDC